ncbi:glycosyl hydrolase 2 galactose-binding domain-containing protein [Bacillus sp. 3255]|uniref:glycoside hydrolase family 2 protein n=1 Tax=Bacillus sp. 3255 TaxID=2817904 RepID=UPI00286586FF|nr:glycoside hydrolase family 2 TIM barrel-domain containing protein [Bacillus sp. 3255]MDR6882580.1 beta-mannosidase [Bacillus sp. 3255]
MRIDLNGSDWLFKDFLGEDWVWRNAEKPDTKDSRWWRKGTVPGTVLYDLWHNGEVADPYYERNSLLAEWVPERTWVYKKWFDIDGALKGSRVQLHVKGVDHEAQFFLNGLRIGHHKGMFTAAVFDVTDALEYGAANLLAVVIEKAPDEQPQVSKTSYVREHKSRMTYWWDFCPRMIHQGIWDDVYLDVTGGIRIEDVHVKTELSDGYQTADLSIAAKLSASLPGEVRVETRIVHEGETVFASVNEYRLPEGETELALAVRLNEPRLWQPNGSGEAHLYYVLMEVYDKEAAPEGNGHFPLSASEAITFGIRKVAWQRNETPDASARPYVMTVNGRRTYIKGWNWVPMDVMYGRPQPEKLERLLTLARAAGVNMLRVWGGGLIEKDAFYELCDRFGIMVWQEFIQSSSGIANKPSEEPAFVEMMAREAESIAPRKRNHPSLVLWCGGNELQDGEGRPLDDTEPVLGALRGVVERLHPGALWLPTSPSGRCFLNSLEAIEQDPEGQHDVHGPWEYQGLTEHYTLYNQGTSLLHSEFGVEGMTHLKTLNHTVRADNQWPATRENPVYFHRGSWWNNEGMIQRSFGHALTEPAALIRASQLLQAEGLRYAVESNIRRMWQNSGTLPWQFNEPYPNAYCTSALDYYTLPKPAYYAVARAYRPVYVSASFSRMAWEGQQAFKAELWGVQTLSHRTGKLVTHWSVTGASGNVYAEGSWQGDLEPGHVKRLGVMELPLSKLTEDVFFLRVQLAQEDEAGAHELVSDSCYPFSRKADLTPYLELPQTHLQAERIQSGEEPGTDWLVRITNTGAHAAFDVQLTDARPILEAGFVYLSDNAFPIFPGESKLIRVTWSAVAETSRQLELTAWNSAVQHL